MFDVIRSTETILNPQFNTAFNALLANLLQLALLGVATLAAMVLRTIHKEKMSWWKRMVVERIVKYVEQAYTDNDDKRDTAALLISKQFPRLEAPEIIHLLEEAVVNMKLQAAGIVTVTAVPPLNKEEVKP